MVLRRSPFREEAGGCPVHAIVQWTDGASFRLIRHKNGH